MSEINTTPVGVAGRRTRRRPTAEELQARWAAREAQALKEADALVVVDKAVRGHYGPLADGNFSQVMVRVNRDGLLQGVAADLAKAGRLEIGRISGYTDVGYEAETRGSGARWLAGLESLRCTPEDRIYFRVESRAEELWLHATNALTGEAGIGIRRWYATVKLRAMLREREYQRAAHVELMDGGSSELVVLASDGKSHERFSHSRVFELVCEKYQKVSQTVALAHQLCGVEVKNGLNADFPTRSEWFEIHRDYIPPVSDEFAPWEAVCEEPTSWEPVCEEPEPLTEWEELLGEGV
jgi:hypothetical protein